MYDSSLRAYKSIKEFTVKCDICRKQNKTRTRINQQGEYEICDQCWEDKKQADLDFNN